jgi:hypothetical protein
MTWLLLLAIAVPVGVAVAVLAYWIGERNWR